MLLQDLHFNSCYHIFKTISQISDSDENPIHELVLGQWNVKPFIQQVCVEFFIKTLYGSKLIILSPALAKACPFALPMQEGGKEGML